MTLEYLQQINFKMFQYQLCYVVHTLIKKYPCSQKDVTLHTQEIGISSWIQWNTMFKARLDCALKNLI